MAACLLAGLMLALRAGAAPPAAPDLVARLEASPVVVVGTFESVAPLAHSAHVGALRVEQVLRGREPEHPVVEVVWEEPGLTVPARFARGSRALLGLAPLPSASIWRQRLPDAAQRARVVAIEGGGRASLARPSGAEIDLLVHYLALDDEARAGDAGLTRLAQLAAVAEPGLARSAIARLGEVYARGDRRLPREAGEALARVLLRTDAPSLAADTVAWLERAQPREIAPQLRAAAAARGGPVPVALRGAIAAVEGELDPALTAELVRSQDEAERLLACRWARGDLARTLLPALIIGDPSARVRAEAVTRWVALAGTNALPEAVRAFEDHSGAVRRAAIEAVASLGEPALPELVAVAETGSGDGARAAVASLSMMGAPARPELQRLAAEHDDEAIRTLARMALGMPIGHQD